MKHLIVLSFALFTNSAFAETVAWCTQKDERNTETRLTLENDKDLIFEEFDENQKLISRTVVNSERSNIWDGHMTGLITTPGFAMSYENHFGCVRNARVTLVANRSVDESFGIIMKQIEFKSCKGLSAGFCGP